MWFMVCHKPARAWSVNDKTNDTRKIAGRRFAVAKSATKSDERGRQPSTETAMLKTRIIPCLDVKDGRVVKGVNFVDLIDAGDPVAAAAAYDAAGADELCFLDITATHENRGIIFDIVERTAARCFMPLTVGGGVRTSDDIRRSPTITNPPSFRVRISSQSTSEEGISIHCSAPPGSRSPMITPPLTRTTTASGRPGRKPCSRAGIPTFGTWATARAL